MNNSIVKFEKDEKREKETKEKTRRVVRIDPVITKTNRMTVTADP